MSNSLNDGTAASLVAYLDVIIDKGRATQGAITPLRTAFVKVVEAVDGTDWGATEVNNIDIDDYTSRFANLTAGKYTDKSISVYKSRINKVIDWYKKFLVQPGWMPLIKPQAPRQKKNTVQTSITSHDKQNNQVYESNTESSAGDRFEIGFQNGQKALIILPLERTAKDMNKLEKLIAFIKDTSDTEDGGNEEARTTEA